MAGSQIMLERAIGPCTFGVSCCATVHLAGWLQCARVRGVGRGWLRLPVAQCVRPPRRAQSGASEHRGQCDSKETERLQTGLTVRDTSAAHRY